MMARTLHLFFILAAAAMPAVAQVTPTGAPAARAESVSVIPGALYRSGAFGRFVFGDHYRDLWTTRLTVPVLSLERFAGGLRPTQRGGSRQTRSLRFAGADGSEYVFRSVDKDPSVSLPPELRRTYANHIVRDLISAAHPGAALVVAGLLDAVGILHATPQLAVMPDDPRLGEFRAEFAGMLGLIEERPSTADDDAPANERVLSSEKLFKRLDEHDEEFVDARAFLKARLFDVFVGDWDRHPDQWRWLRMGSAATDGWQPVPRDRDWALVRLDGLVWATARIVYPFPQFVSFDEAYPDIVWLTWNGRRLDRRILSGLERPVWDSVAVALRDHLSDAAIGEAIARLPAELGGACAATLRRRLERRRDMIPDAARRFYSILAAEVDVHATDARETIDVVRENDRFTTVSISARTRGGSREIFRRRFDARETREIRIYARDGDDRVGIRGSADSDTRVRVIGGQGRDVFTDSTRGARNVRLYDAGKNTVTENSARIIDDREYQEPPTRRGWIDPPRDWGSRWRPMPWVSYAPMVGFFVGGGPIYKRYGFRTHPYSYGMAARVGYATTANQWRAEYEADFRRSNSDMHATFSARYSGIDILRFYGFGNGTIPLGSSRYHAVEQQLVSLEPMLHLTLAKHLDFAVGAFARYSSTDLRGNRFIDATRPYGSGNFGQIGARQLLSYDTRDVPAHASRGAYIAVEGTEYPSLWSARRPFASLRSSASTYLSAPIPTTPVLALRVGGQKLWGTYPFSEAAFIGGASTVRSFSEQRFAGDASVYGNAEVRLSVARIFLLLPGELGAFGLADGGRVYRSEETSDTWHTALGGGLWVSFLERANTFSAAYARGREGGGFYFKMGMNY